MKTTAFAIAWGISFALIGFATLVPNIMQMAQGMDKVAHLGAFAFLMLWPATLFRNMRIIMMSAALLFAAGIAIEILQNYVPRRSPDIMDALFNMLGVCMGLMIGTYAKALIPKGAAINSSIKISQQYHA